MGNKIVSVPHMGVLTILLVSGTIQQPEQSIKEKGRKTRESIVYDSQHFFKN